MLSLKYPLPSKKELVEAAKNGDTKTVEIILHSIFNTSSTLLDKEAILSLFTAFEAAAAGGHKETVKVFLWYKQRIGVEQIKKASEEALKNDHAGTVEIFLEQKEWVSTEETLYNAIRFQRPAVVALILSKYPDISVTNQCRYHLQEPSRSLFMIAVETEGPLADKVLEIILKERPNISIARLGVGLLTATTLRFYGKIAIILRTRRDFPYGDNETGIVFIQEALNNITQNNDENPQRPQTIQLLTDYLKYLNLRKSNHHSSSFVTILREAIPLSEEEVAKETWAKTQKLRFYYTGRPICLLFKPHIAALYYFSVIQVALQNDSMPTELLWLIMDYCYTHYLVPAIEYDKLSESNLQRIGLFKDDMKMETSELFELLYNTNTVKSQSNKLLNTFTDTPALLISEFSSVLSSPQISAETKNSSEDENTNITKTTIKLMNG